MPDTSQIRVADHRVENLPQVFFKPVDCSAQILIGFISVRHGQRVGRVTHDVVDVCLHLFEEFDQRPRVRVRLFVNV